MSKVTELRTELDRVESAAGELETLAETKTKLVASLDSLSKLLAQARDAYNKAAVGYAELLVEAQEVNERGQSLSRITGQRWQGIDLPKQYGYSDNILGGHKNPLLYASGNSDRLAIHEGLVPAVFGGDTFELLRQKRTGR
ncbi:MAG TPA: hypothetical protein ACFYD1_00540 [Candidatus Hypogeohydataceae bacterium YC38]|nr:hypothetical protein [Candidatus Brocadiales bacterium]